MRDAKLVRLSRGRIVDVLTPYTHEGGIYLLQRDISPLLSLSNLFIDF